MSEQWRIAHKEHPLANFRALEYHDEPNSDGQEWWFQAWLPDFIAEIIETEIADLRTQAEKAESDAKQLVAIADASHAKAYRQYDEEMADLKLSVSEVLTALDGREPEGGVYISQAAQRAADLRRQLGELDEANTGLAGLLIESRTQLADREETYQASMAALAGEIAGLRDSERNLKTHLEQMTQERAGWKQNASETHGAGGHVATKAQEYRTHAKALAEALEAYPYISPKARAALTAWQG